MTQKGMTTMQCSGIPVFDNQARSLYHYIAEGIVLSSEWYRSLNKPAEEITVFAEIVGEAHGNFEETEDKAGDAGDVGDVGDAGDVSNVGNVGDVGDIADVQAADESDSDS